MALFEYFPNYIWNLSVAIAMESGGRRRCRHARVHEAMGGNG